MQTISFSKQVDFLREAIGIYKMIDRSVTTSEELPLVKLGVRVLRGVDAIRVTHAQDAIYVEGVMAQGNRSGLPVLKYRLFFRQGPVSATNYTLTVPGEVNVGPDQFFTVVTHEQLRAASVLPGQQITVIGYGDNEFADTYLDPVTKLVIYPTVNEIGSNYESFSY